MTTLKGNVVPDRRSSQLKNESFKILYLLGTVTTVGFKKQVSEFYFGR